MIRSPGRFLTNLSLSILTLALLLLAFPHFDARAYPGGGYISPVEGPVLRGFEKPTGPYGKGGHQGIDIAASAGTPVRAANSGVVAWVGEVPRGRFVSLSHPDGVRTVYLDLDQVRVSTGDSVRRGQAIGTVSGSSDDSSVGPHLHFGAYLHGNPVDPQVLFEGLDSSSWVRLCPMGSGEHANSSADAPAAESGSWWRSVVDGLGVIKDGLEHAVGALWGGAKHLVCGAWRGVGVAGSWACSALDSIWDDFVYPSLCRTARAISDAFAWAWSNKWVQALVAGIAAALVVVGLVALAVITVGLSLVVAAIAAIAASLAAIGYALYYAATCGADFNFTSCFLGSLSVGAIAAGLVVSASSLAGAFSAGWAKLGVLGTTKAATWNGLCSAAFEAGTSYVFTGQVNPSRLLVAFGIGALSGAVGKLLREGLTTTRVTRLFSLTASRTRGGFVSMGNSVLAIVRQSTVTVHGFLVVVKDVAMSLGGKLAFMGFSGSFGAAINVLACTLTGKEITLSSAFTSFVAGVAMGALALSFGRKGLNGLLSRIKVFREGMGRTLRRVIAKVGKKLINKSMKSGLQFTFEKIFGEEDHP